MNSELVSLKDINIGKIERKLKAIAKEIIDTTGTTDKIGLLDGKMGIAIFFYELSRWTKNKDYENFADGLIDEIFDKINKNEVPFHFSGGLEGIAWGIEYLSENKFIEGDTNEILAELDDKVYQHYIDIDKTRVNSTEQLIGNGFYMLARYKKINAFGDNTQKYIYKRYISDIVNNLYYCIDNNLIETKEPLIYNIVWHLPLILIFLGKAYNADIQREKIVKMAEQLTPTVLSLLPMQHANRLFLLFGMYSFFINYKIKDWDSQIRLLEDQTSIKKILSEEMNNKKYNLLMGYSGIFFILSSFNQFPTNFNKNNYNVEHLLDEICLPMQNRKNKTDISLLNGLTGKALGILMGLKNNLFRL